MAGRLVWPGIFPGARLSRAHKAKIIEAFDPERWHYQLLIAKRKEP